MTCGFLVFMSTEDDCHFSQSVHLPTPTGALSSRFASSTCAYVISAVVGKRVQLSVTQLDNVTSSPGETCRHLLDVEDGRHGSRSLCVPQTTSGGVFTSVSNSIQFWIKPQTTSNPSPWILTYKGNVSQNENHNSNDVTSFQFWGASVQNPFATAKCVRLRVTS